MALRIFLEKENFKFSCSHFTILGNDSAERLHGHNYYVRVELETLHLDPTFGMAFDFNDIKPLVRTILDELDERVLLPQKSRFLKIETRADSVVALLTLGTLSKRYELPLQDVKLLETVNITSEELARLIAERLLTDLKLRRLSQHISELAVVVEETRGQSVRYSLDARHE